MGVISERKRPAEDQELDDGGKRLHRSSEKEFDDGYDIELQSSSEYRNFEGEEHELISNVLASETDDIFLYSSGIGVYNESIENLIIGGDLTTNTNASCETEFPRDDYASSEHHGCYMSAINGFSDLQKNEEEGRSEMQGTCYDHGSPLPLEGLDLFFDDVGLGFGVHEDDSLEFVAELVKRPGEEGCEIFSELGACSGVTVAAEQAFIEENEVHDWLFGGSQRSPAPDSLQNCCTAAGGDHLLVLNEPSLAHVLEGMSTGT